jgi:hypothetical protein
LIKNGGVLLPFLIRHQQRPYIETLLLQAAKPTLQKHLRCFAASGELKKRFWQVKNAGLFF